MSVPKDETYDFTLPKNFTIKMFRPCYGTLGINFFTSGNACKVCLLVGMLVRFANI